jgi:hypothetical protein
MNDGLTLRQPAVKAGFGKHLLFFPSRKVSRQVVCHSTLEADYCVLLEHDRAVLCYQSQPRKLELRVQGRLVHYHPDFYVETQEDDYYTEVKVDFSQVSLRCAAKLSAARELLNGEGTDLMLADLASIRSKYRMRNIKFLYFHSFNVGPDEFGGCLRVLPKLSYPVTFRQLLNHRARIRERTVYRAIFEGYLQVDLCQPLTIDSPIEGCLHADQLPPNRCTVQTRWSSL